MTKRPAVDPDLLHEQAQAAVLAGLRRGDDVGSLIAAVAPFDIQGSFTPDVAMLELAVDALELACTPGSDLVEYEGLRERFLPEVEFRGRTDHRNSQYAIYATACLRGGLRPDLLHDAGWWHTGLWIYATYALAIYTRAAADRRGTTSGEIARLIADRRAGEETSIPMSRHEMKRDVTAHRRLPLRRAAVPSAHATTGAVESALLAPATSATEPCAP